MTMRVISTGDLHRLTSQCINAALSLHMVICRLDEEHEAQDILNTGLHNALGAATNCCQLYANPLRAVAPEVTKESEPPTKDETNDFPD